MTIMLSNWPVVQGMVHTIAAAGQANVQAVAIASDTAMTKLGPVNFTCASAAITGGRWPITVSYGTYTATVSPAMTPAPTAASVSTVFPTSGPRAGSWVTEIRVYNPNQVAGVARSVNASNPSLVSGSFQVLSQTTIAGSILVVTARVPAAVADSSIQCVLHMSEGSPLGPFTLRFRNPSALSARIGLLSHNASTVAGGLQVNTVIEGMRPVSSIDVVDSITVMFGSIRASVTRIRSSTADRTVIDYAVPPSVDVGEVTVAIYRSVDPSSTAVTYRHAYTQAPAALAVSSCSTEGGLEFEATVYGFSALPESAYSTMVADFGGVPGTVVEIISSDGLTRQAVLLIRSPPRQSPGTVTLTITSLIFDGSSSAAFTYYSPSSVTLASPSYGSTSGGSTITVEMINFPRVAFPVQLSCEFDGVAGEVKAIVASTLSRTVVELAAPASSGAGVVEAMIIPMIYATEAERLHRAVRFSFRYISEGGMVTSVSPSSAPASVGGIVKLQLSQLRSVPTTGVTVRMGPDSVIAQVQSIDFSDNYGTQVSILVPPALPSGLISGVVRAGDDYMVFVYESVPDSARVVSASTTEAPASGGSIVTLTLSGMPYTASTGSLSISVEGVEARIMSISPGSTASTTDVGFQVPYFAGGGFGPDGLAIVQVHGRFADMNPTIPIEFTMEFGYRAKFGVAAAILSTTFDGIAVELNQAANNPVSNCTHVFAPSSYVALGTGATCVWATPFQCTVTFGVGASVVAGQMLSLIDTLMPAVAVEKASTSFEVLSPGSRAQPPQVGLFGPASVGPCDSATYHASVAPAPGTTFSWDCAGYSGTGTDEACSSLSSRLSTESGASVTLVQSDLAKLTGGSLSSYTIRVSVTTSAGAASSSTATLPMSVSQLGAPSITVYGPASFTSSQPVFLEARATPSMCPSSPYSAPCRTGFYSASVVTTGLQQSTGPQCVACSTGAPSVTNAYATKQYKQMCLFDDLVLYEWYKVLPGGTRQRPPVSTAPQLVLPPQAASTANDPHRYVVVAYLASDGASSAEAAVSFSVDPAPLEAAIIGGDRLVGTMIDTVLDASASVDPSTAMAALSFEWSCVSEGGNACRNGATGQALSLAPAPVVVIPSGFMSSGDEYHVTVRVSSADRRKSSATVVLTADDTVIDPVYIVREGTVNVEPVLPGHPLILAADGGASTGLEWASSSRGAPLDLSDLVGRFPLGVTGRRFKAMPGSLVPGLVYSFALMDPSGVEIAWFDARAAKSPAGGSCTLSPSTGIAFVTDFTVSCSGFGGPGSPELSYSIGFENEADVLFTSSPSPLASTTTKLPVGDAVRAIVVVSYSASAGGASTTVTTNAANVAVGASLSSMLSAASSEISRAARLGDMLMLENSVSALAISLDAQMVSDSSGAKTAREEMARAVESVALRSAVTPAIAKRLLNVMSGVAWYSDDLTIATVASYAAVLDHISGTSGLGSASGVSASDATLAVSTLGSVLAAQARLSQSGGGILTQDQQLSLGRAYEKLAEGLAQATAGDLVLGEEDRAGGVETLVSWVAGKRTISQLEGEGRFVMAEAQTNDREVPSFTLPAGFVASTPDLSAMQADSSVIFVRSSANVGTPISQAYTLSLFDSASSERIVASNLAEPILISIPFDIQSLTASQQSDFMSGEAVRCLHWVGEIPSGDPTMLPNSPWSSTGCRLQSISSALANDGTVAATRGSAVCACNHLTTFVVDYGFQPVRFDAATPQRGDVYQAEAGVPVVFTARGISTVSSGISVSLMGLPDLYPSFSAAAFTPITIGSCAVTLSAACVEWESRSDFSWTPKESGDYDLTIVLSSSGTEIETRDISIRVLFCEHYIRAGQSLRDVAQIVHTTWQALFVLNPEITRPENVPVVAGGRTVVCDDTGCALDVLQTPGARIRIGKVVAVGYNETVADIVGLTGSTMTSLVRHNAMRLQKLSDDVYDIVPPGERVSADHNVTYTGVGLCMVSPMAENCFL